MNKTTEHHTQGRRGFLRTAATMATGVGLLGSSALTSPAAAGTVRGGAPGPRGRLPAKIDVHAHYLPPDYRAALVANGYSKPDGFPVLPTWSPQAHVAFMDDLRIQTSMLSISSPGVLFGENTTTWARKVNEAGAQAVRDHPDRFGLFATLPLPDVDAALDEIAYAFDVLQADGIALLTNYHGVYLGDPRLDPVMAELHRRKAVVFLHPTSPVCWEQSALGYPRPILEFLLDTTRAVSNLILTGRQSRFSNIELIVPHCGAALPVLADRIAGFAGIFGLGGQPAGGVDVLAALQRLHYDVAGFATPRHLKALLELVDSGRLLFGSDFPFTSTTGASGNAKALIASRDLNTRELRNVLAHNAAELVPRLAGDR